MENQYIWNKPVIIDITKVLQSDFNDMINAITLDPGPGDILYFNVGAMEILSSKFENLSGPYDGGYQAVFQVHELLSCMHIIESLRASEQDHGISVSRSVAYFAKRCARLILAELDRERLSSIINAIANLYLPLEQRNALPQEERGKHEVKLHEFEQEMIRMSLESLVKIDAVLYPHCQTELLEV